MTGSVAHHHSQCYVLDEGRDSDLFCRFSSRSVGYGQMYCCDHSTSSDDEINSHSYTEYRLDIPNYPSTAADTTELMRDREKFCPGSYEIPHENEVSLKI